MSHGSNFGAVSVNGDVYRCCARTKEMYLGNIIDGTFKLLEKPEIWYYAVKEKCACYKAMIAGEEKNWCEDMWHWPYNEKGVYYER